MKHLMGVLAAFGVVAVFMAPIMGGTLERTIIGSACLIAAVLLYGIKEIVEAIKSRK